MMISPAILMIAIALASGPANDHADRLKPVLQRVAKMDLAQQQAWLRRLETRANRAATLALPPDAAARQTATTQSQLHQKAITWQTLLNVIEETDTREREATAKLAARYRRAVSENFAAQLDAYGRRQQAWRDVYAAWKGAGEQFEQQDRLLDWLEAAVRSVTPESSGPIPETPTFAGGRSLAQPTPKPERRAPQTPSATGPDAANEIVAKPATRRPAEPALPPPEPAVELSASTRSATPLPMQRHDRDLRPQQPSPIPAARTSALRVVEPQPQVTSTETARLPIRETALKSLPASAVEVRREITVAHPAPQSPAESGDALSEETAHQPVEVRLDELAARIGGYNLAIRALEIDLDENGDWTAQRLEPLVRRLTVLAVRRHDLDLFREAVPAEQRSSLAQLSPAKSAVSQFATRIFEARSRATDVNFTGADQDREIELQRLDDLSRRLAEAAGK